MVTFFRHFFPLRVLPKKYLLLLLLSLVSFIGFLFLSLVSCHYVTCNLIETPQAAPEYWRMLDPYWNGTGPPLRCQTAELEDKVWGGHESCYSIVTSLLADGKIRQHYVRIDRWPMYVTRKEDWSWEISNNSCIYRSIPDADKEDGTGPLFLLY